MATITGLTAARMIAIEAASIVSGVISGDDLILTKFGGGTINAGNVRGPKGDKGDPGNGSVDSVNGDLGPAVILDAADVGAHPAGQLGTTSTPGLTRFATSTDVFDGVQTQHAVTPAALKVASNALWEKSGTSAHRNTIYGVPTTTVAKVALANQRPMWYNIEKGWLESYYVKTGTSGLSVPGISGEANDGWYPVGAGPWVRLVGNAQTVSPGLIYSNYLAIAGANASRRRVTTGAPELTYSAGKVTAVVAGWYDVSARIYVTNGGGTFVGSLCATNAGGTATDTMQNPIPLLSGFGQVRIFDLNRIYIPQGGQVFYRNDSGNGSQRVISLTINYAAPPLQYNT